MSKWKMVKLGDVVNITSGQGAPQGEQFYSEIGVPFIKAGHLLDLTMGKKEHELKKIEDSVAKKHRLKKFSKDTILFAKSGMSCLKGYVYQLQNDSYVVNHLACVTPNNKIIYPTYLKYYFMFFKPNRLVIDESYPSIRLRDISNMDILLPPIDIQQKIADILDKSNAILEKRRAQIDKLDLLVKSQFIEMFGDPVINPKGWELKQWKDVLTIKNGKNQKNVETENGKYPICGSGGIIGYSNDYITEADSVIIGRKGNINRPILMKERFWNVDTAFGLEPHKDKLSEIFLYLFCVWFDFEKLNRTVTIPSLTKTDLLKINMPVPPVDLQNQFASFVQQVESQKSLIQASLDKLELNHKSLIQNCFKGEMFNG